MRLSLIIASTAALAISGCASVQMGDAARSAEIKKFEPSAGMGQIYVCRNGKTMGMGIRPDVELDGRTMATIARNTYAYQEIPPGSHTLIVKTLEHDSKMPFTIAAGEQKFFQTWISMGVLVGWGIVDEIERAPGIECVTASELVEAVRTQ